MYAKLLRFSSYIPVLILKCKRLKFSQTNNFSQINKFLVTYEMHVEVMLEAFLSSDIYIVFFLSTVWCFWGKTARYAYMFMQHGILNNNWLICNLCKWHFWKLALGNAIALYGIIRPYMNWKRYYARVTNCNCENKKKKSEDQWPYITHLSAESMLNWTWQTMKYMSTKCCISFNPCRSIRKQIGPCHKNGHHLKQNL